jgi:hypothetical protein
MKVQRRLLEFLAGGLAIFAMGVAAAAQSPAPVPPPPPLEPGPTLFYQEFSPPGPPPEAVDVGFVGFEAGPGDKVVKAAPYSAQVSTDMTQVLSDGNRINRKNTGMVYRDSEGRTRREQTMNSIGPFATGGNPIQVVLINDPVAGVHYVLEPQRKVARKMPMPPGGFLKAPETRRLSVASQEEVKSESLGQQVMEGITVEGTRITRTIPVGAIGNELPIEIVTERWFSSDLQANLMVKRIDPRIGTSVYQLTNITRSDPAAPLFQVPADYIVQEGKPGSFRIERRLQP